MRSLTALRMAPLPLTISSAYRARWMTFRSRLESGGTICPKCGSKAIKASAPPEKTDPDKVQVSMFCATCGARWRDTYTLSKSEEL